MKNDTLTAAAPPLPVFQLKKILVPVDFSECSRKALQYAIPFARQFGAELTILHVIEPAVFLTMAEALPQQMEMTESVDDAKKHLDKLRETVGENVACQTVVREGAAYLEILDAAKELDSDLVILSTHGRTGLQHVLMGSTVEKVVRRCQCPVLIVREHEHEFIRISGAS